MKGKIITLFLLAVTLTLPSLAFSDCLTFGTVQRPVSWQVVDERTVAFYEGVTPIALVRVQTCTLSPSSTVRLIKRYLCDSDKIIIDNEPCNIMTITSASSGSYQ